MGIDFGSKKVGLALSDESRRMAFPHSVIPNDADMLGTIVSLIETEGVGEVVCGHSLNNDGTDNVIHAATESFITDLTLQLPIPIHLQPEQYTTQAASRIQGKDAQTDAAAAALILESYLAKNRPGSAFDDLNE